MTIRVGLCGSGNLSHIYAWIGRAIATGKERCGTGKPNGSRVD